MDDKTFEERTKTYQQYKVDKQFIRKNYPNKYDMEDTLNVLRSMYSYLKRHHFDLPKLQKRTIDKFPKGNNRDNSAYCSPSKKIIKFKPIILKKRVAVHEFLGSNEWKIYEGTLMLAELLTHEVSHFKVKGLHNKRFYHRQTQLLDTLINGIISGEYYKI